MKTLLTIISFLTPILLMAQVGAFSFNMDIGDPAIHGSSIYDEESQTYTITGSGYNIWFERDEFQFLYNKIGDDFIATAEFEFVGEGTESHRKVGWMVRGSEDDQASHFSATLHGDGLTVAQWRELPGAFMRDPEDEIFSPKSHYSILQVERTGDMFTMRAAHPGEPLQTIGHHSMTSMGDSVLLGLFICSHNEKVKETARIRNVRIDLPVANDYEPGTQGWLGCRLEILNVFDGHRTSIFERDDRFEAPNWMPDGKNLLFNMDGALYKISIDGKSLGKINTGSANRLNNDHGISFDGKMIAISHHRDGYPGGGSAVYVLPIEGGEPKLITEETPSYWHGWAPNNEEVVYVAQRDGRPVYDIYKKSINGGPEVKLTDNRLGQHVDGCEFSPDGQYIYYNGSASGTMQIWRMKPDGSNKEQLTFDEYNDWFPHISPDGKWIAYISFPKSIPVNSHPSYKRCMLRLMSTQGSESKVIAHLYGGQGTINVPSWSPDSRFLSFVSNSGK